MRLLLDEHLSPEIARQLRERGHDVIIVGERVDLRGRPERVHFASLPAEQRAIVTRDLADFRPLLAEQLRGGGKTYGLVCVPARFPLNRDGIGHLVPALDVLLLANPSVDAATALGGEIWLQDAAPQLTTRIPGLVRPSRFPEPDRDHGTHPIIQASLRHQTSPAPTVADQKCCLGCEGFRKPGAAQQPGADIDTLAPSSVAATDEDRHSDRTAACS